MAAERTAKQAGKAYGSAIKQAMRQFD